MTTRPDGDSLSVGRCRAVVTLLALACWLVVSNKGLALTLIDTDTTINDATFSQDGIEVRQGGDGSMTKVMIQPGAQIGAGSFTFDSLTRSTVSVAARDDSMIDISGGTLTGKILLLDTSNLVVSDSPSVDAESSNAIELFDNATADFSGATVTWGTDLIGNNSLIMAGGTVDARDFVDVRSDAVMASMNLSNIAINGRDAFDLFSSTTATLTDVTAGRDTIDYFERSTVIWTGGSITSEDGTADSSSDAFDVSRDGSVLDVDGVNITGTDALDSNDGSQVTLANLTIDGADAVDTNDNSRVELVNVTIIGRDAIDVFDESDLSLDNVSITGDDAIDTFSTSTLSIKNLAMDTSGFGLEAFDESVMTIFGLEFKVDGMPVGLGPVAAESGQLLAVMNNGQTLDVAFFRDPTASIILVPEPAMVVWVMTALLIRRRFA